MVPDVFWKLAFTGRGSHYLLYIVDELQFQANVTYQISVLILLTRVSLHAFGTNVVAEVPFC